MIDFTSINNKSVRIERVNKDGNGYFVEAGTNLFGKPNKQYLTDIEVGKYKEIIKQNKIFQERHDAIEEAKKEGRYKTVEQVINQSNGGSGIIAYEYYDRNGRAI